MNDTNYACQTCGKQHSHVSDYTALHPVSIWQPCADCNVDTCQHGIKHGATDMYACTQCVLAAK